MTTKNSDSIYSSSNKFKKINKQKVFNIEYKVY